MGVRTSTARVAGAVLTGLVVLAAGPARLAAGQHADAAERPLLDVPYLAQSGELCGGAALAMVLRYWGVRDVFAEDFSALLDRRTGGIPTDVLTSAARARASSASVMGGTRDDSNTNLRAALARGHPVIALIQVSPQAYHYVVIVGLTEAAVVFHDPARAPFRVMPLETFDRAWSATERWTLLVLPAGAGSTVLSAAPPAPVAAKDTAAATPCGALVAHSVDAALGGHADDAEQGLLAAMRLCPKDAGPRRELAGLRFVASRWEESARLAAEAVRLAPKDSDAWRVLAASEYVQGHWSAALTAWNHVDEPRVDTIDVEGAARTRRPVIGRVLGLTPRQLLTADAFDRAARRLDALPAGAAAQLRVEPTAGGTARVRAIVSERDPLPNGAMTLGIMSTRALFGHQVQAHVANPTGSGDLWTGMWRWSDGRPRVGFRLAMPAPHALHGIVSLDASWERETYGFATGSPDPFSDRISRRRVGAGLSDWAPHQLRWRIGAAMDRLDERDFVSVDGGVDKRLFGDHVAVVAGTSWWWAAKSGRPFNTGTLAASWRSTVMPSTPMWSGVAGLSVAGTGAPRVLWPGAGTGAGRELLLRAHPLVRQGLITGEAFGRRIAYATAEYERPLRRPALAHPAAAVFVDAARTWNRAVAPSSSRLLVDIGAGLRARASNLGGVIRLDVAYGLRDGRRALSAGWAMTWPR